MTSKLPNNFDLQLTDEDREWASNLNRPEPVGVRVEQVSPLPLRLIVATVVVSLLIILGVMSFISV